MNRTRAGGRAWCTVGRLPLSLLLRRLRYRTIWTIPLDITRWGLENAHTLVMKLHTRPKKESSSAHVHFEQETENLDRLTHSLPQFLLSQPIICSSSSGQPGLVWVEGESTHIPARNAITIAIPRFVRVNRIVLPPSTRACPLVLLIAGCRRRRAVWVRGSLWVGFRFRFPPLSATVVVVPVPLLLMVPALDFFLGRSRRSFFGPGTADRTFPTRCRGLTFACGAW
jgi:hypothetical protein